MLMKNESIETVGLPTSSLNNKEKKTLSSFLNSHSVGRCKSHLATHVSLSGGSYNIPYGSDDYIEFIKLYKTCVSNNGNPKLVELFKGVDHKHYPLIIDLDFRQSEENRLYDRSLIDKFVSLINKELYDHVDIYSSLNVYILEKGSKARY